MDYADDGDLLSRIQHHQKQTSMFEEEDIWNVLVKLAKGLKALHKAKILHRDIKSANVFLCKNGEVKLGDMNVSKVTQQGLCETQTGTPYYASPEVWKDQPYDNKSDIWSLGCVIYQMASLQPPFKAEDMEGLYKKVIRGLYPRIPPDYSSDLSNIIRCMLQVAPQSRPSASKLLEMGPLAKRNSATIKSNSNISQREEEITNLLGTIKIPRNISNLTNQLPKPNYGDAEQGKFKRRSLAKNEHTRTVVHLGSQTDSKSIQFYQFTSQIQAVLAPQRSLGKIKSPVGRLSYEKKPPKNQEKQLERRREYSQIQLPPIIQKLPPIRK